MNMNKSFMTAMAGLMIILGIMSQLDKYLQDSKYGFLINLFVFMVGLNIILMVYLIMSYEEVISKPGVKGPKGLPGRQGDDGAGDTCGLCKPRPNNFEREREKVIIKKSIISGLDCSKCKVRYVKFNNDNTPRIGYQKPHSAKVSVWEINKTLDDNSNSRIHWGRVILPMGSGYRSSDIPWRSQTSYSKILNGPVSKSYDHYSLKSNNSTKCKSSYPTDPNCWKTIFGYPAMETGLPPKEAFEDLYTDEQATALMFYDHPDTGGEVWFKIGIPSSIIKKNELIDHNAYQKRQRIILKEDCPDFCDLQT